MLGLVDTRALVIFCVAIALLLPEISFAKNCTSSDITLADQGDVNLFQQAPVAGAPGHVTGTLRMKTATAQTLQT